jgi:hypothetical protein
MNAKKAMIAAVRIITNRMRTEINCGEKDQVTNRGAYSDHFTGRVPPTEIALKNKDKKH